MELLQQGKEIRQLSLQLRLWHVVTTDLGREKETMNAMESWHLGQNKREASGRLEAKSRQAVTLAQTREQCLLALLGLLCHFWRHLGHRSLADTRHLPSSPV